MINEDLIRKLSAMNPKEHVLVHHGKHCYALSVVVETAKVDANGVINPNGPYDVVVLKTMT